MNTQRENQSQKLLLYFRTKTIEFQIGFLTVRGISKRGLGDLLEKQICNGPFIPTSIDSSYTWEMKYRKSQLD